MAVLETIGSAFLSALWYAVWLVVFLWTITTLCGLFKIGKAATTGFAAGWRTEWHRIRAGVTLKAEGPRPGTVLKAECGRCGGAGNIAQRNDAGAFSIKCTPCGGTGMIERRVMKP